MRFFKTLSLSAAACLLFATQKTQARQYESGMIPGMALRLEQSTVNKFIGSIKDFLPHYVYQDMLLPGYEKYTVGAFFDLIQWTIEWKDITYSVPKFDIEDIQFNMNNDFGVPKIDADFPVLEDWKINAIQNTNSIWLPKDSPVELGFKDFDINFSTTLITNEEGNIKPHFWQIHLKFGDSYFTHENWFFAFTFHQTVKFAMIVVENTAFICGELILSEMGEPILTQAFNNYKMPFRQMPTPFLGQGNIRDDFIFDWRLTRDPDVSQGQMDLFFHGEIYQENGVGCGDLEIDPFDFLGETSMSQVVISEGAATCLLNQVASSQIGQLSLNETQLNALFNVTGIKFDSKSFGKYFPILQEKIGTKKPVPLRAQASISDALVKLGQFDSDVRLEYTLNLGFYADLKESKNSTETELLYDEIRMVTAFNMRTKDDMVYLNVQDNKIKMDAQFGGRQAPVRNNIKMLNNEYREYLTQYGYAAYQMQLWLNQDIFKDGVRFPYKPTEFLTNIQFSDKSAHIMFEIESGMEALLEDRLW